MGGGGGGYGARHGVGRDDGFEAYLLDLLQPTLLPQVRVRILATAEGARAPCMERTFGVVADHTRAGPRERLRHGVHVLLRNEDHDLLKSTTGRDHAQRPP